jgi:hypothetical protein
MAMKAAIGRVPEERHGGSAEAAEPAGTAIAVMILTIPTT